jgi:hypothetical protein
MPGRGGAVTGGTLDQSTFACGDGVVAPVGGAVVGATVVLPAGGGGGSAAIALNAKPRALMPIQNLDNEPGVLIPDLVQDVFRWRLSKADETGRLRRFMEGSLKYYSWQKKLPGTIAE